MIEALQILWITITNIVGAIANAFLSLFPFVKEINDLKDFIYAELFGVPVWVVSVVGTLITICMFLARVVIKKRISF